jgi:4-aminobutyrate aminotransferase-like enzyme
VNVGYGQDSVVQAATEQMRRLPYATGYFHYSSEPAIRLAAKLVQITPASLTRVYLTLGGSEAVDAAVRFIVQYHNATAADEEAVHLAGARLPRLVVDRRRPDRLPAFHRGFDLPLPTQHYIESPYAYRHPQGSTRRR